MPESVEKIAERLDSARADVDALDREAAALESDAEAAVKAGDFDRADSIRDELDDVLTRRDRRRSDVATLEAGLADAREAETRDAARRRRDELTILISTRIDNAGAKRGKVESELDDVVDAAEAYLGVLDDVRKLDAEIDMLCDLYDIARPDTPGVDMEEYQRFLSDELSPAVERLRRFLRRYPLTVRQSPPGMMLERRLSDLFGEENGIGNVYGRARGVRSMLSDATREVAEPAIRERLEALYAAISDERKDKVRAPRE